MRRRSGGRRASRSHNSTELAAQDTAYFGLASGIAELERAETFPLHAVVTLRKCSTLYKFPNNLSSNTARAPAGGTYRVNPP